MGYWYVVHVFTRDACLTIGLVVVCFIQLCECVLSLKNKTASLKLISLCPLFVSLFLSLSLCPSLPSLLLLLLVWFSSAAYFESKQTNKGKKNTRAILQLR